MKRVVYVCKVAMIIQIKCLKIVLFLCQTQFSDDQIAGESYLFILSSPPLPPPPLFLSFFIAFRLSVLSLYSKSSSSSFIRLFVFICLFRL